MMDLEPPYPDLLAGLDRIEGEEANLLAWGLTGGSWTERELEALLDGGDHDPADLIDGLRRHKLIVELPGSSPSRYRSRTAEAVRLFAALRQLFPERDWAASPRLVADYRFLVQSRRFPVREHGADKVVADLGGQALGAKAIQALRALIADGLGGDARPLSTFQVEAAGAVLKALSQDEDWGVIVTAGTGAGKTLAFYLPAFMRLAEAPGEPPATKVLALYPRNELLKDQLLATVREARRLRASAQGLRPIRIGAYFGNTPTLPGPDLPDWLGWRGRSDGDACPFLPCPDCEQQLVWKTEDRKAERERLVCRCGTIIGEDLLVLTRQAMQASPPDILFSTTEMLNRTVMDQWSRHVFGVGSKAAAPPLLVLLDEVHTYEGAAGAQAAYLLRRWRHLVDRPLAWVGLSATLRNAEGFFADLTGLRLDHVVEAGPRPEELAACGKEYQLVLRGDPASSTALLSTSIQSLMLLRRILDVHRDDPSGGAFGSKVFAFCDNLDLVNRLYRQQLHAEGFDPIGKPRPAPDKPLAVLRSSHHTPETVMDWPARDADGQQWWMVDRIGHPASGPKVSRTSSQDAGVAEDAEIVVATASLEVGYDDPDVGAVLQHKAPRDVAQFLQRRGRAGRSQMMRPWTVIVLSDYGRDRLAYQSYEQLLEPELPPKSLPLGNRSVQRMQAGFALLDWLTIRLDESHPAQKGSVRDDLSRPVDQNNTWKKERQERLTRLLASLLDDAAERGRFTRWLRKSLGLSAADLDALCWDRPRSLFLDVVPTALRRLESNWQTVRDGAVVVGGDRHFPDHPLPEFLPAKLFGDLCLPEVHIEPPDDYDRSADTAEAVFLALNDFAPGRVTLRYAVRKVRGLWIDPGGLTPDGSRRRLELSEALTGDADRLGEVPDDDGDPVPLLRPYRVRPTVPPKEVAATSNGRWHWRFTCAPVFEPLPAELPRNSPWTALVPAARFFLHGGRGGLRVWRYALDGTADVIRNRERERFRFSCAHKGAPVAIGFEAVVDAFAVEVTPPPNTASFRLTSDERRLRNLRRERFAAEVAARLEAETDLTSFLAAWVADVALAVTARAVASGECSLAEVAGMGLSRWAEEADIVLGTIFQSLEPSGDATPGGVDPDSPKLRARLVETFGTEKVTEVLAQALPILEADPDDTWYPWLRTRFVRTVAAAVHAAAQLLCFDFDAEDDLIVDVTDPGDGPATAWLTETSVGGGGIVEAVHSRYAADPRRFWTLVLGALEPSDLESVDTALRRALQALRDDPDVRAAANAYRKESSPESMLATWRQLLAALSRRGVPPVHATVVALANRLLRAGTSPATDEAVAAALDQWGRCEERLGFALDHRSACAVLAEDGAVRDGLRRAVPVAVVGDEVRWAFTTLLGLLWVPAEALRGTALSAPSRSWPVPPTERTLVLDQLPGATARVDLDMPEWRSAVNRHLVSGGRCLVGAGADREGELKAALVALATEPVEVGALHVYPRVGALRRTGEGVEVELELSEVSQ